VKTMLDQIVLTKQQEIKKLKLPEERHAVKKYSLYSAVEKRKSPVGIIAEVKKASPSKGIISRNFNPVSIAKGYEKGGAAAISVLTDETYFKGNITFLSQIKEEVELPVLRKDFIIDESQIIQSRLIGADAILLIAGILTPNQLHEYYEYAHEQGLEALVEIHNEKELEATLSKFTPKLLGINNRDLKTFTTSLSVTKKLAMFIPKETLFVSESGIYSHDDMMYVKDSGAAAVLVGESLMKAQSPELGVMALLGDIQ
jgi:indole-3-glycerol phosphate synthase